MQNSFKFLLGLALVAVLASCASSKKFVYLQDMVPGVDYPIEGRYEAKVQRDDRLSITVTSKTPELAIPFNMKGGNYSVGPDGSVVSSAIDAADQKGYRVDVDGNIDFPILGKLHVAGLTVTEVQNLIRDKIIEGGYIKSPIVSLEFLNFRYSVIGAVAQNGTFTVDGDRINLIEAIARAGDLTTAARVDKVGVLREEDGVRKLYMHDLRSKEIFDSPCFYLNQNDVIIVERKYLKSDVEDRTWKVVTSISSVLGTLSSIIWAITLLGI